MENSKYLKQIQQYAVRIGKSEDKELYGTGTLFLVSKRKKVCVFTAAHVVYSLIEKIQNKELKICLTCKDNQNNSQCIIVDDPKCICIHSKYKNNKGKDFFNDLALIDIPWKSWMDDMKGFGFASGDSGIKIKGYGFPLSLDGEKNGKESDLFSGIGMLRGIIESKNAGRLAVRYDVNVGSDIDRDSIMEGYSGTGLFSADEEDGICYRGLVSCSRGDKAAGYTIWATDAEKIIELMRENDIEIECPESFEPYGKLVADEFPEYKKNSKRNWNTVTCELIKNKKISPKDFKMQTKSSFLCVGERKLCDEFWKGKLKELVVMHEIQEITCEELIEPIMQLPNGCGGKDVTLKFLCTEDKAECILGKMIEGRQFAKDGEYQNNMIFLINSPKGHDNHMTTISRADCRSIMENIAEDSTSTEELRELTENILDEEQKDAEFDIIKGAMGKCNIAAFGSGRLMDVLTKDTIEKMKTKWNCFLVELWEV